MPLASWRGTIELLDVCNQLSSRWYKTGSFIPYAKSSLDEYPSSGESDSILRARTSGPRLHAQSAGECARHRVWRGYPTHRDAGQSLSWDRGLEMAKHKIFTVATDVKVCSCDPQSPRQRGPNENTNGLLRQYFPRRTDLSGYTQVDLDKVALRLNQRPRKTLGFQTPASKLQESVASTG